MAEAIVNEHRKPRFQAFSAAVEPSEAPEELALGALQRAGYRIEGLAPKDWQKFVEDGAPPLDFVFTLSDTAAGEQSPEWPGGPVTAHWSYLDPVLVEGEEWERRQAYGRLLSGLERHLRTFMEFPITTLDRMSLVQKIEELGKETGKAVKEG